MGRCCTEVRGRPAGELRERVGRVFGKTGRSVSRYVALLKAPRAVQDAFRQDKLTLVLAGWVAGLDVGDQAEIARRIEAGEDPRGSRTRDTWPRPEEGRPARRSPVSPCPPTGTPAAATPL